MICNLQIVSQKSQQSRNELRGNESFLQPTVIISPRNHHIDIRTYVRWYAGYGPSCNMKMNNVGKKVV